MRVAGIPPDVRTDPPARLLDVAPHTAIVTGASHPPAPARAGRAAEPRGRRAAGPQSRRAAGPQSRRAAGPPGRTDAARAVLARAAAPH
ncbi:hypothetical protein JCM9533A_23650 [Catenuloplanes niger JCM 9533]